MFCVWFILAIKISQFRWIWTAFFLNAHLNGAVINRMQNESPGTQSTNERASERTKGTNVPSNDDAVNQFHLKNVKCNWSIHSRKPRSISTEFLSSHPLLQTKRSIKSITIICSCTSNVEEGKGKKSWCENCLKIDVIFCMHFILRFDISVSISFQFPNDNYISWVAATWKCSLLSTRITHIPCREANLKEKNTHTRGMEREIVMKKKKPHI